MGRPVCGTLRAHVRTPPAAIALCFVMACAQPPLREPRPPALQSTYFVDPKGDDDRGDGTRESPFRTIAAALLPEGLERIVVAPGRYDEEEIVVTRSVEVFGPGDGQATLNGHLEIEANGVRIHGLDVTRGLAIRTSEAVTISALRVASATRADALFVDRSNVDLLDLRLEGGAETCLSISSSTVTAERLELVGSTSSKRGLRAISSSVTVEASTASGCSISQVQAERSTRLTLSGSTLSSSGGNGVVSLSASSLRLSTTTVEGARDIALLVSVAELEASDSTFRSTREGVTIGLQGATVRISDCTIEGSIQGTLTVGRQRTTISDVRILRSTFALGTSQGLSLTSGRLALSDVRIVGPSELVGGGSDAIVAVSEESSLELERTTIEHAGSWAIVARQSASVSIDGGRFERPREGGVLVDESPGASIRLRGLVIDGPQLASGVAIFEAQDVTLENVEVSRSAEAGLLLGSSAYARVSSSRFIENRSYGLGAFGGSTIEVSATEAKGSKWAAFATCGDGSTIVDLGDNVFEGTTILCR